MRAPDFWGPGPASVTGRFIAAVLSPVGCVYGAVTASRAARLARWQAPVPVICIGNATMGGAGKTQVCIDLARRLSSSDRKAHVLSRGYGGRLEGPIRVDPALHSAADVGDEALVLARHTPTWIGADRTSTARAATDAGAGLIVMDDGFQNPALHKDVNLVVIDGGYGFGNGHMFPAGPLRESAASAFRRADAVCVIGTPGPGMPDIPAHLPIFAAVIKPDPVLPSVAAKKVVAFAGIGRPDKFFDTLRDAGADVAKTFRFPDHHPFRDHELNAIIKDAEATDASILTTEKDHARLSPAYRDRIEPFPVMLDWADGGALESFILKRIGLN